MFLQQRLHEIALAFLAAARVGSTRFKRLCLSTMFQEIVPNNKSSSQVLAYNGAALALGQLIRRVLVIGICLGAF